ncbi:Calx-beta domain-containing protein, partial [Thermodesulfobacteriota bacterium]
DTAEFTIKDNESGNEDGGGITFTIELSNPVSEETSVAVSAADGTATIADSDYTALSGVEVIFAAGSTSETFEVLPTDDYKVEGDETFTVSLGAVTSSYGTVTASAATKTGTINDNVDTAEFTIKDNESGNEDGGPITFTIELSNPVDEATSVAVSTADGTATEADSDYTALSGVVVNFAAGDTSKTFEVVPTSDSTVEGDETFTVSLGAVTGGYGQVTASAATKTGTINDNVDTAEFTIKDNESGNEDGGPITFTIELSNPVSEETKVAVTSQTVLD